MSTARTKTNKIYYWPEVKPWIVRLLAKHMSSNHSMAVWNDWALKAWNKLKIEPLDMAQAVKVLRNVYATERGGDLFRRKILPLVDPGADISRLLELEKKLSTIIWENRRGELDKSAVFEDVVIGAHHVYPFWKSSVQKFSNTEGVTAELSDCYDCLLVTRALEVLAGHSERLVSISNYGEFSRW